VSRTYGAPGEDGAVRELVGDKWQATTALKEANDFA
jgi:hypothetical protein